MIANRCDTRAGLCSLILTVVLLGQSFSPEALGQDMDSDPLSMPKPGDHQLRVLTPTLLELVLINTKDPDPAQLTLWNFVNSSGNASLPSPSQFVVTANGRSIAVQQVGFKRRVLYAPLIDWPQEIEDRDLRIWNSLYLRLATPVADNETVEVRNPSNTVWPSTMNFVDNADPFRWNPGIHVNHIGYMPGHAKEAIIGYFCGSLYEMDVPTASFQIVNAVTKAVVYQGTLTSRADPGFWGTPVPYQNVKEADFTGFNTPGEYQLVVPGLGASFPFFIQDGIAAAATRAYAQGLYNQRCGSAISMPYTRHSHAACHVPAAEVPTSASHPTWSILADVTEGATSDPRHTAPRLQSPATSLYPFVRQGPVDVSGGHHDAGDYSKYTINSALLINGLVFAADAFPGAGELDNLGIPESGDGKSDLLQEAKYEADFLAKMQDTDGGFYFLVYPRARPYESNVLPDQGDPQVVWPKTTTVTASAVAALAQTASSPRFKQQFPQEAAVYLQKATLGFQFLENAIAQYGKDGSYQKITHYGANFWHDDELVWAAAEMFVATGDPHYQQKLMEWMPDPSASSVKRYTWWRLFEGYGGAIRAYAFAVPTGRLSASQMNAAYLAKCQSEVKLAGEDQHRRSLESAYGTSFPDESKGYMTAGWYFSASQAFDIAAAHVLDPKPGYINTIVANMNYEMGCNPVNMSFVTGLGWKRWRDIVHQYAKNDHRVLPPSGIPLGNLTTGFVWNEYYPEVKDLAYPPDEAVQFHYPLYDRWGDSWNVTTEFVVVDSARGLGALAFLMGRTPLKTQSWQTANMAITGLPGQGAVGQPVTASLQVSGLDVTGASVIWEARDQEPHSGMQFTFSPKNSGSNWVEAELMTPDGRRISAASVLQVGGGGGTGLPTLTVAATDANAAENGPDSGTFSITRTGATTTALSVIYSIGGSATNGSDYQLLSGILTIPAGSATGSVTVVPIADGLTEGIETVSMTLLSSAQYQVGSPSSATIQIADGTGSAKPLVNVVALDASASEAGPDTGSFSIARAGGSGGSLTVSYSVGGTATSGADYQALSGSVTIPVGASTAMVTVTPIADTATEGNETVILTISANSAYDIGLPASATVNISDDAEPPANQPKPYVSVATYSPTTAEGASDASITFMRDDDMISFPLTVRYTISGTASNGVDYQTLSGALIIPVGSAAGEVEINALADSVSEGNETVTLTLVADPAYILGNQTSATITIVDANPPPSLPTVTLSVSDANASEVGLDSGSFIIGRNGSTASSLLVSYSIGGSATNGTDYNSLPGSVSIPAGSATAVITVTPKSDTAVEGTETVTLTLAASSAYQAGSPSSGTVSIADEPPPPPVLPTVTLSATDASASEVGPDNGSFAVSRTGSTATSLTVSYSIGGSASNGGDYNTLSTSVMIPAGSSSASVLVVPKSDQLTEGTETVVLTLAGSSAYQVGSPSSATVSIADAPPLPPALPAVTLGASNPNASETGPVSGSFTLNRSGGTTSPLTVQCVISGTATNGTDYESLGAFVTIPVGASSLTVMVIPKPDAVVEGTETVVATLTPSSAYTVGSPSTATVNIADGTGPEPPAALHVVYVSATDAHLSERSGSANFRVTRLGSDQSAPLTIYYTLGGEAQNGTDYRTLPGFVTIAAGSRSANIRVYGVRDNENEGTERVILTLSVDPTYILDEEYSATAYLHNSR